uniref:BED-type domain-containing protein n=1 Tax=Rhabditophanes sp. KR3021 TaxID=114890 RepID=A0AC35TLJ2_9BILA
MLTFYRVHLDPNMDISDTAIGINNDQEINLLEDSINLRKVDNINQESYLPKSIAGNNNILEEIPIKPHGNKRRQPHPVNIYFEFFRENFEAVCNMCKKKVKCPKTFNLKRHLARYHADEFKRVEAIWNRINSEKISANAISRKNSPSPGQLTSQQDTNVSIKLAHQLFVQHAQQISNHSTPTNIKSNGTLRNACLQQPHFNQRLPTSERLKSPLPNNANNVHIRTLPDLTNQLKIKKNGGMNHLEQTLNPQISQFFAMIQSMQHNNISSSNHSSATDSPVSIISSTTTTPTKKEVQSEGLLIKKMPRGNREEDRNDKAKRLLTCYALTAKFSLVDMDNAFLRELLSMIPNFDVPSSKGLTDLMIDAVLKYGD